MRFQSRAVKALVMQSSRLQGGFCSHPLHTLSLSFASFSLVYELQEARTPFVPPSTTHAHKGLIAHAPLPFQVRLPLFT